jgi:hypothetical protein
VYWIVQDIESCCGHVARTVHIGSSCGNALTQLPCDAAANRSISTLVTKRLVNCGLCLYVQFHMQGSGKQKQEMKTPWPEPASYTATLILSLVGQVSDHICVQRAPYGQRDGSLRPYSRISRPEPLLFYPSSSSVVLTEWTPFQTHYFSENLITPGIEPGPLSRSNE